MCYIIDSNHGIKAGTLIREQPIDSAIDGIEIGDDVWIGAAYTILKGADVIGANSLLNSEISPNAIAFGTPAKVYSFRK